MAAQTINYGKKSDSEILSDGETEQLKYSFLDRIIEILLIGLLALLPLAFGGVQAWSEELAIFIAGLIAVCFCIKLITNPQQRLIKTWAYAPILLFIFIIALQLIPLPAAIVKIFSPNTIALRTEFLSNLPGSENDTEWTQFSLYPYATKHGLRLILAIVSVFVVVLNVFHKREQIKRLLWSISLIGGTVALITLSQNIFGNGKIYWLISTPNSNGHSGPFINHSNYGQFINLSIAAALGALIVGLTESFAYRRTTVSQVFDFLASQTARRLWLLAGVISICIATIFLSLTRGGIISLMAAMCFTVIILARTHSLKGQGWLFLLIAFAAFACILYAGFDVVYERLAMLRNWRQSNCGRIQILKDIGIMFEKFPFLGTGLSTHEYVYPMFDRSYIPLPAAHAENEYAQVLEETGLIGLGTLIIFAFIVGGHYIKCIRNQSSLICSASYGLGFGIVTILIHSLSDFGQHIPANAFLTATFCALLIVLGKRPSANAIHSPLRTPIRKGRLPRTIALVGVCILWLWAISDANQHRVAEKHWARVTEIEKKLTNREWEGTDYQYGRLVYHAKAAVNSDPEDIKHRYWLNIYRYGSLAKEISDAGQTTVAEDKLPEVRDITKQLYEICRDCPTYGQAYFTAGRIEKYVLCNDSGSELMEKAYRLARNNWKIFFLTGYSDASEGDINGAVEKFARAIRLNRQLYGRVAAIYIDNLSRPELAIQAAGDDVNKLNQLFNLLSEAEYFDYARQIRDKLISILEDKRKNEHLKDEEYRLLGVYYEQIQKPEAAIECYRQALQLRNNEVVWRYEFASLLADRGRISEAMDEARICLQLKPGFTKAKNLLAECSVHPSVLKESVNQY